MRNATGTTLNYCFIPEGYGSNGKCEILVAGCTEVDFYVNYDVLPTTYVCDLISRLTGILTGLFVAQS